MTVQRFDQIIKELEASEDFRVLRRVRERPIVKRGPRRGQKIAIIVDTETTGLDTDQDEVIEIGLVAFAYEPTGSTGDVIGTFNALREPSVSISPLITKLTGITSAMVRGRQLNENALTTFISSAALLIAHNAAFDRPMCEKLSKCFAEKPWACSATDIDWQDYGFEGNKLGYLIGQCGLFHRGHRALDDCWAVLELLERPLPEEAESAFGKLLASARKVRSRIWVKSPYELRNTLKARGYRWNPGSNGRPRSWWIEVDEEQQDEELSYLLGKVTIPESNYFVEKVTAFERFKSYEELRVFESW